MMEHFLWLLISKLVNFSQTPTSHWSQTSAFEQVIKEMSSIKVDELQVRVYVVLQ